MAEIKVTSKLNFSVTLTLNEEEIRALAGIFGYNEDAFLKAFYEKMGRAYVQPHEAGVRSLHQSVRRVTGPAIYEIDRIRKAMTESLAPLPR